MTLYDHVHNRVGDLPNRVEFMLQILHDWAKLKLGSHTSVKLKTKNFTRHTTHDFACMFPYTRQKHDTTA